MEKQCVLPGTLNECATLDTARDVATMCDALDHNTLSYTSSAEITTLRSELGANRSTASNVSDTPIALC